MKTYHISELEQLSGVKAHTIRIWEKRYNLIEPDRTDTNIRMYDDNQVRKLLNVSTLLANGFKISKIAELKIEEIHSEIKKLQAEEGDQDTIALSYTNDFVAALLDFNEQAFEKTFSAVLTRLGMYNAMINVFYPLLKRIGLMWSTGEAMPVQEHFASTIVRRKLLAAIDGLPFPTKSGRIFLLMLPPDEYHEIGLLFSEYILRSKGIQTIYLGANVPYENVKVVFTKTKVTHVLTFLVTRRNEAELHVLRKLMAMPATIPLLVAGSIQNTDLIAKQKQVVIMDSPQTLLKFV